LKVVTLVLFALFKAEVAGLFPAVLQNCPFSYYYYKKMQKLACGKQSFNMLHKC